MGTSEGHQIYNYNFLNKTGNHRTIDTLYVYLNICIYFVCSVCVFDTEQDI